MATTRRLVAVFAADVAGYSRLMELDEEDTHKRLSQHFDQLIVPKIREHHGQVVKNTGDGLLAEFASVVDAVRCATEIQRGMIDRDPEVPDEARIKFRIGVNLGDVIAERGDIFGDGVNVAARLQTLAEPGGVCISRTVREQIRDKFAFRFEDLGEQSVKNIARPVRVYSLTPDTIATLPKTQVTASSPATNPVHRLSIAALTLISILVVAGALWWLTSSLKAPSSQVTASANQTMRAPKRLSIVVLPFKNLSNDPEQQYFADGVTEDVTTDLSRIVDLFVIAPSTAFTYKEKPVNTQQIGRELSVRYVLEGSVQRLGKQLRINAHLIDAETSHQLWANNFAYDTGDLLTLQNDLTHRIASALGETMVRTEAARPTANPDALDYILRARAVLRRPYTRVTVGEAIKLLEQALTLDPNSVEAKLWLASSLAINVLNEFGDTPSADMARANVLIEQARSAEPDNTWAHLVKGDVLRAQGQWEEASRELELVVSTNSNWSGAWHGLGQCRLFMGAIDEVIPAEQRSIELDPLGPGVAFAFARIGLVYILKSQFTEAIGWLEKARNLNPNIAFFREFLVSAYALNGEPERAAEELEQRRKMSPRLLSIAERKTRLETQLHASPKYLALREETVFAGLRKAGVPEQ